MESQEYEQHTQEHQTPKTQEETGSQETASAGTFAKNEGIKGYNEAVAHLREFLEQPVLEQPAGNLSIEELAQLGKNVKEIVLAFGSLQENEFAYNEGGVELKGKHTAHVLKTGIEDESDKPKSELTASVAMDSKELVTLARNTIGLEGKITPDYVINLATSTEAKYAPVATENGIQYTPDQGPESKVRFEEILRKGLNDLLSAIEKVRVNKDTGSQ
ncbi:MAG: hypothetical protein NZM26_04895 [Patescibacteria group bacterium]|nr:hypothetical protein [Patescibacteria group bacterium]